MLREAESKLKRENFTQPYEASHIASRRFGRDMWQASYADVMVTNGLARCA